MKKKIAYYVLLGLIFCTVNKAFSQYEEKVILNLDREIYIVGEEILLSAYCFAGADTFMSKILYVELFDLSNNIISQQKLKIENNVTSGRIDIPKFIQSNTYFVRVYTSFLKEFNIYNYPTKKIIVVNPNSPPKIKNSTNINSKSPGIIKEIINIDGDNGYFNFTIEFDSLDLGANYNFTIFSENYKKLLDFPQNAYHTYSIPKESLPKSLIYATVVSDDSVKYARPFYNWLQTSQNIDFKTNKTLFKPREKVNVTIKNVKEFKYISAIVLDKSVSNREFIIPDDILNNPDLLKFYLNENHTLVESFKDTIDFVLKNVGRKLGNTVFQDKFSQTNNALLASVPSNAGVQVSGKVTKNNNPAEKARLYLSVFEGDIQFHSTETDSTGNFNFLLYPNTFEKNRLIIMPENNTENELEILVDYDYSGQLPNFSNSEFNIDSTYKDLLERLYLNQQINELTSKQMQYENNFENQFGTPDYLVKLEDFINLSDFEEVFDEIVPHVSIKKKNQVKYFEVFDEVKNTRYNNPLVLLDFAPVFDVNKLLNTKVSTIHSISVTNKSYQLGEFTYSGILSITTKRNDFSDYAFPKNVVFLEYQGASRPFVFQNPDYSDDKLKLESLPDFRTVLYWNPNISSDSISFYTSDYCADFQVILSGIDKDGVVVKSICTITVKK